MTSRRPGARGAATAGGGPVRRRARGARGRRRPARGRRPAGLAPEPARRAGVRRGDRELGVSRKFFGDDPLVDRAVVSLLGRQGLMLVGEPGTAKSLLSELLAAAASGTSTPHGAGHRGHERGPRAVLVELRAPHRGGAQRALARPVARLPRDGERRVARFEEITRCAPEIQDTLVSVLSEKQLMVPSSAPTPASRRGPGSTCSPPRTSATAGPRDVGRAQAALQL